MTKKFFDDPDEPGKNAARAEWAEVGLKAFADETGLDIDEESDGPETVIGDLLGNIGHYCDRNGLDLRDLLRKAANHYNAETSGQGEQFKLPYTLITVSGGVADIGRITPSLSVDVEILDYDNIKGALCENDPGVYSIDISEDALEYMRKHDSEAFVSEVEEFLKKQKELEDAQGK